MCRGHVQILHEGKAAISLLSIFYGLSVVNTLSFSSRLFSLDVRRCLDDVFQTPVAPFFCNLHLLINWLAKLWVGWRHEMNRLANYSSGHLQFSRLKAVLTCMYREIVNALELHE